MIVTTTTTTSRHLLVFAAYYPPFTGGYARSVSELCRRLIKRGWKVTVISSWTDGGERQEAVDGVNVFRLSVWDFLGTFPIPIPNGYFFGMLKEIFAMRIDCISTQTRFFPTSILGLCIGALRRIPIVHTERGSVHTASNNIIIKTINWIVDHTLGSLLVRYATMCAGVSSAAASFCRHLGAKNAMVIHNGINVERYSQADPVGATGRPVEIVYIGRLIWAKGVHDLLESIARLRDEGLSIRLTIAGKGNYESALRTIVNKKSLTNLVTFLGDRPSTEMPEILSRAQIFVNPSYSEGLPTSVLEGAVSGLAVIATKVGGTEEIITNNETGLLIDRQRPEQLDDAFRKLITDPDLRKRLGEAAWAKTRERFRWDAVADEYEREYIKAAEKTSR